MSAEYIPFILEASRIATETMLKIISNQGIEKEKMNNHYKKHSEQLVTALLQWGNRMNFSTCEYKDGDLSFSEQIQPSDISYLEDAMKHVKASYTDILKRYESIEDRHRELCKQINRVMKLGSVVPSEPSYEEIILSKIKQCCPQLKSSKDMDLRENNIFLILRIFNTIFEKVTYEKSEIKLFVDSNNGIYRLTDRARVFAQGTSEDMSNLKGALEKLVSNEEVKKRINLYHELYFQLMIHEDSDILRETIRRIYDIVHGGKFLGGIQACDLCIPDSIPQ
jgi:hypothetical protein